MADPKYANLPGIDQGSPDVYETSDLPEDDQAAQKEVEEAESEDIEKMHLDTKKAHKTFKGKVASGAATDFSDKITKHRGTGYDVSQSEYEMREDGALGETPQQKYQRLQHEIRQLTEEITKIKDSVKDEGSQDKVSAVALGKQLEYLQHQLVDLHLEKLLGPSATIDLSDPAGAIRQRLVSQLESYKPPAAAKDVTRGGGGGGGGGGDAASAEHVTYQLFYRPEQAQFSKNARVASLEERLERLEAAVGTNMDKLNLLTSDTDTKSLVGAVSTLNSKLSLLDASTVEQTEARLHNILHKMTQIAEKKTATQEADPEKSKKVDELYELVKRWESVSDSLPGIVERLTSLKELHEQALQFSQAISYLDAAQQEVASSLHSHSDMLKQHEATFKQNMEAIKTNFTNLEKRMAALKKS